MIPYTAVYKYSIKPKLTIVWEYKECGKNKVYEEKFNTKAIMNMKLSAFNNLVDSGAMYNYLRKAQKIK